MSALGRNLPLDVSRGMSAKGQKAAPPREDATEVDHAWVLPAASSPQAGLSP